MSFSRTFQGLCKPCILWPIIRTVTLRVLMMGHKICFGWELRKIISELSSIPPLIWSSATYPMFIFFYSYLCFSLYQFIPSILVSTIRGTDCPVTPSWKTALILNLYFIFGIRSLSVKLAYFPWIVSVFGGLFWVCSAPCSVYLLVPEYVSYKTGKEIL